MLAEKRFESKISIWESQQCFATMQVFSRSTIMVVLSLFRSSRRSVLCIQCLESMTKMHLTKSLVHPLEPNCNRRQFESQSPGWILNQTKQTKILAVSVSNFEMTNLNSEEGRVRSARSAGESLVVRSSDEQHCYTLTAVIIFRNRLRLFVWFIFFCCH